MATGALLFFCADRSSSCFEVEEEDDDDEEDGVGLDEDPDDFPRWCLSGCLDACVSRGRLDSSSVEGVAFFDGIIGTLSLLVRPDRSVLSAAPPTEDLDR